MLKCKILEKKIKKLKIVGMRWALVLSGGGAKGIPYIGMFKAFEELKIPQPSLIVGCSIGAVVGSMYAAGKNANEMEKIFLDDFDAKKYLSSGNSVPLKYLNKLIGVGTYISNLINGNSMDDGRKVYVLFQKLTDKKKFSETKIPFVCNSLDLHTGHEEVLSEGELAKAVLASSAYPVAFPPVRIGDKLLVDGGMTNNTPVHIAKNLGFKNVLSVTLSHFKKTAFPENYKTATSLITRTVACVFNYKNFRPEDFPSFWLDLSNDIDNADFTNFPQKIEWGYKKTLEAKDDLKAYFSNDIRSMFFRFRLKSQIKKNYRI